MPAEWEPHEAIWLSWPHKEASWPGIFERIPPVWAVLIRALRETEEVRLLSCSPEMDGEVRRALGGDLSGVRLFRIPTNDAWIRDYGPIFVRSAERGLAITAWGFNSWGGKYGPWDRDEAVPGTIAAHLGLPCIRTGMILEGGSIDVDGEGTLLTTESCLLNPNRNPQLDRKGIEGRLDRFLGARKVLWLGAGIVGDDTDGHVDDLARFISPGRVAVAIGKDPADENYGVLRENRERLEGMRDAAGRRIEIVELPLPPPVLHSGQRCPASYMNFLIANHAVLVPTFRSPEDARVLGTLSELFPQRKVSGIDCHDLVWGLGAIHCVSQQQPLPPGR